ncbi:hypothetical protein L249_8835 [Ophiocordyceps polyrhachis-furcata BCC 54312]|uniref:UDP-N-acetylglucosamine transferase subunit ALG13 n=1 Tax=Ophiocordyceps polyrhachis-furcata BCC 54312 TaxID=1330021 RepID=A0A367L1Q6_9HYPO|nr:hypothetical protein L249_8835 [Ophiocordyceps polyrhachis-furcata BCC 54312]
MERHCLVTVGATVGFRALLEAVLEPSFWLFLKAESFTTLHIQAGPDARWANSRVAAVRHEMPPGFDVEVFDLTADLMRDQMLRCKARDKVRERGLVISHAGTGTILDAWKVAVPLIVVPNSALLDDHQTDMARHLAQEGYATMADPRQDDLEEAVRKSARLCEESKASHRPHPVRAPLRLWDIFPIDISTEEPVRLAYD